MKCEWTDDNYLYIGGIAAYHVWKHIRLYYAQPIDINGDPLPEFGPFDSEQAAKAAAEKAVREWIVSLLGEPVAWRTEYCEHHPYGDTTAAEWFVEFHEAPDNLPNNAVPLYAINFYALEDSDARYLTPDEDRAIRRAAERSMTILDDGEAHDGE